MVGLLVWRGRAFSEEGALGKEQKSHRQRLNSVLNTQAHFDQSLSLYGCFSSEMASLLTHPRVCCPKAVKPAVPLFEARLGSRSAPPPNIHPLSLPH